MGKDAAGRYFKETVITDSAGTPQKIAPSVGKYETVAASQTAQVLGTAGAIGDYLDRLIVIPLTTAPGLVTILDNAISIPIWLGGTVGADLKPFIIDVRAFSVSGAWKVTTGANVSVLAVGSFT